MATTAPSDPPCKAQPATRHVSAFYGEQELDRGPVRRFVDAPWFRTGPFYGNVSTLEVDSCVADDAPGGLVPADVVLDLTDDGSGPSLKSFLGAAVVIDGEGRSWSAVDVATDTGDDGTHMRIDDLTVQTVTLRYELPLDVPVPVHLALPDLDGPGALPGSDARLMWIALSAADEGDPVDPTAPQSTPGRDAP